jgi:hypothetical protein
MNSSSLPTPKKLMLLPLSMLEEKGLQTLTNRFPAELAQEEATTEMPQDPETEAAPDAARLHLMLRRRTAT